MKKALVIILTSVLLAGLLLCGADAALVTKSDICMPQIELTFVSQNDLSVLKTDEISAELDGEALKVESLTADRSGVLCVFMLDVSQSMPQAHFEAAKAAIMKAYESLRSEDEMALIACGSGVNVLLSGGESAEEAASVINGLKNGDVNTMLYSGVSAVAKILKSRTDMRSCAVVISDGVDDTQTGITREQLGNELAGLDVKINGLCVDSSSQAAHETFSDIIGLSGGEIYSFSAENADETLNSILEVREDVWMLNMSAESNAVDGAEKKLVVRLGTIEVIEQTVKPEKWTPDNQPPAVSSARYDAGKNCINIKFTESVSGADEAAAYAVTDETGAAMEVASITKNSDGSRSVLLAQTPAQGSSFTLKISGVTDASMEKNAMHDYSGTFTAAGAAEPKSAEITEEKNEEKPTSITIILLIFGGFIVVAAVLVFAIVSATKRKDAAKKTDEKKKKETAEDRKKAAKGRKSGATFYFEDEDKKEE